MSPLRILRGARDAISQAVEHFGRLGDEVSIRRPDVMRQSTLCRCPGCGLTQLVALAQRCADVGSCRAVLLTDLHAVGPVETHYTEGPAILPRFP